MTEQRCAAGNVPERCCVGDPWTKLTAMDVMRYGEPLDPAIINAAAASGVEPHALDQHVGGVHGWESHDTGYDAHVPIAVKCLTGDGCVFETTPEE